MARYLISFDDGSMDHIPDADFPAVGEASRTVVREAKAAGVWIFGGGLYRQQASYVGTDGSVIPGPVPETKAVVGGFAFAGNQFDRALLGKRRTSADRRFMLLYSGVAITLILSGRHYGA